MDQALSGVRKATFATVAAVSLALTLAACGAPAKPVSTGAVVTTPQAALAGEWVLTRTVTASDDVTDPERLLGAVSTRLVSIEQEKCQTALCPGTVSSGISTSGRETTPLLQTDGGVTWTFEGTLNCLNVASGQVQVADAFSYKAVSTLTVANSAEVDGVLTASELSGTMTLTDSLSVDAFASGCRRDPAQTTVEYTLAAVRAPADAATSAPAAGG